MTRDSVCATTWGISLQRAKQCVLERYPNFDACIEGRNSDGQNLGAYTFYAANFMRRLSMHNLLLRRSLKSWKKLLQNSLY